MTERQMLFLADVGLVILQSPTRADFMLDKRGCDEMTAQPTHSLLQDSPASDLKPSF